MGKGLRWERGLDRVRLCLRGHLACYIVGHVHRQSSSDDAHARGCPFILLAERCGMGFGSWELSLRRDMDVAVVWCMAKVLKHVLCLALTNCLTNDWYGICVCTTNATDCPHKAA